MIKPDIIGRLFWEVLGFKIGINYQFDCIAAAAAAKSPVAVWLRQLHRLQATQAPYPWNLQEH